MNIENLLDILIYQSKKIPDKIAIFSDTKSYTYKELDILVSKLATYLYKKGIKPKDICLHYFEDDFLLIISMLAIARVGATLIATTSETNDLKINELQKVVDIKWIIDDSFIKFENFEDIQTIQNFQIDKESTWQIVIGSGTTGKKKLFEVSHTLELQRIQISKNSIKLSGSDIVTSLIPLSFYSTKIRFFATLFVGASYFILDKKILNLPYILKTHHINILYSTVFYTELILQSLKNGKNCLDFLRVLSIGGSTVSEELKHKVKEKLTSNLYIGYGTNDIGGITCTNPKTLFTTPQTVGKVLENVIVQIVDNNGCEVQNDQIGELRIKSIGMIQEYFNDQKNTKKFFKEGWFYPGDLGKFTQEKELIHCGRSDQMMILNGINIYPSLIENRLLEHSSVKDVACIPLKDSINQDIPICAVTLKKDHFVSKAYLKNFCYEKLDNASAKDIVILDEIPRNSLGKLQRKVLMEQIYPKLLFNENTSSQTTKKFTLEINKKEIKNLSRINQWLKTLFDIELQDTKNEEHIYTLTKKALYLVRKLLQICKIPNFYLGSLESIKEQNNIYTIDFKLPYIDFIPTTYYTDILNSAFTFLYIMMDNEPTQENQNFFISKYLQPLISPILKNSPQGKSQFEVLKKAYENGIPFRHLGNGIFQLGWGSNAKKIDRSTTSNDSAMGLKLSANKLATANLLRTAGLPCATHGVATNPKEALELASFLKHPLVVKPIDLDRGEGVTVNIENDKKLLKAFHYAYSLSPNKKVLIEKQIKGVCHRVFIAHGKFLYAVKRLPIGVYTDGKNSIETLIDNTNQKEQKKFFWEKKDIYFKDEIAIQIIQKLGFTLNSIPKKDIFIPLREIETTQWGGIDEDVSSIIHQENIALALKAAQLFELDVTGIDIISQDISKPWYKNDAIINELNFAPLLGGGNISKSYIDKYLQLLVPNKGKIPIELFVGEKQKALREAKIKQKDYLQKGFKCYLLTEEFTYDDKFQEIKFQNSNHINRCEALLLDKLVDAILVVDDKNNFYKEYCPFDIITKINCY